jgi:hypothetical protein
MNEKPGQCVGCPPGAGVQWVTETSSGTVCAEHNRYGAWVTDAEDAGE